MLVQSALAQPRRSQHGPSLRYLLGCLAALICALGAVAACDDGTEPSGGDQQPGYGYGPESPAGTTQCPLGQTQCPSGCVDLATDPAQCGVCGQACPAGLYCDAGQCSQLCPSGEMSCNGACVSVLSDPLHCGACGRACAPGEFCVVGACSATCTLSICETAGGLLCVDTRSNARHCGACNAACPAGQSCVEGFCQLLCPDGRTNCNGVCVSTLTNAYHCGACNVACGGSTPCIQGSCNCPAGQALCAGACVDIIANPLHCGGCNQVCAAGMPCVNGQCSCPAGTVPCSGGCVDILADWAHCGECGRACGDGEICDRGTCTAGSAGCAGELTLCASGCVDTQSNSANCGGCDLACPAAQVCEAGTCVCPAGGLLCGASCVDALSSNTHCGTCDNACTAGRICENGQCVCSDGQQLCDGACVDTQTSTSHCGACGDACNGEQVCEGGECACEDGMTLCEELCVDTRTSSEHCGECGEECMGGTICEDSECECPDGHVECDDQCIDPDTSAEHCGGCDQGCYEGEVCSGGNCQGPVGADGCGGMARDLSISEVAVYQSVKIPVASGQEEIVASSRVADVVQGRETLFRVYVDLEPGWTPRELSARLTLVNGTSEDQYHSKKVISQDSTERQTNSTFQIFAPPDKIQADTRYSVEVVECDDLTGTPVAPRFPETDTAALAARQTGPLKIRIIPIQANGRVPDTSDEALQAYRDYMLAMYPVFEVEFTVGTSISTGYPLNWTNLIDQVRSKRQSDAPASDVYYYGFVRPTEDFQDYCGWACTMGIGYVAGLMYAQTRVAVGVAYGGDSSVRTMAHEIGHTHGRNHAPCASGGSIDGVDPNYPYPGARLGVWGYNSLTQVLIDPDEGTDIMGYCANQWVSDYTYRAFTDRVAAINGASFALMTKRSPARWRVLLLDSQGPRWGLPIDEPAQPFGTPEALTVLDDAADAILEVTGYRTLIGDLDGAATVLVPEPEPGWYAVQVQGWPPIEFAAPVSVPAP